jgi:hypothetical protein
MNYLGGTMGAAYDPPNEMNETYPTEPGRVCVARLQYHIETWSAFWIKLQKLDLTRYPRLTLDIRADEPVPWEMKIELKRLCVNGDCGEISTYHLGGRITTYWQTISLDLEDFGSPDWAAPLSSYEDVEELVFTFEFPPAGTNGVVYLDNILFEPSQPPATEP